MVEDGGRVYRRRGQPREPDGPAKPHIYKVDAVLEIAKDFLNTTRKIDFMAGGGAMDLK